MHIHGLVLVLQCLLMNFDVSHLEDYDMFF